jgi:hypothetical protein
MMATSAKASLNSEVASWSPEAAAWCAPKNRARSTRFGFRVRRSLGGLYRLGTQLDALVSLFG